MLPSDSWKTVDELVGHWSGADKVWPRIPLDTIESIAASLRSPPVPCTANRQKYANGTYAIIVELVFADGECWVAKVWTAHGDDDILPEVVSRRVRCEVGTMKAVKKRSSIPVPTVFGYSATADNPIGWPYSLMSAIVGHKPSDLGIKMMYSNDPVPPEKRPLFESYVTSLANVHLQLRNITLDRIGSFYADDDAPEGYVIGPDAETGIPPCATAGEFYAAFADYILQDALGSARAKDHEGRVFGVWLMRLVLSAAALASSHPQRSFPLAHQDLHAENTLVNAKGEIIGVLDWENAACVPEELFASQAIECTKDMIHNFAERLDWFNTYNRALRAAELRLESPALSSGRSLADLHASTLVQMLHTVNMTVGNDPECYAGVNALRAYCRHMLGEVDCEVVRKSPAYQDWLRELSLKH